MCMHLFISLYTKFRSMHSYCDSLKIDFWGPGEPLSLGFRKIKVLHSLLRLPSRVR